MAERTPLVAGNWKMNGSAAMAAALLDAIAADRPAGIEIAVFPPFPYLAQLAPRCRQADIRLGAQDVSRHVQAGAWTGEVSAAMLVDSGCNMVLVGHSERRQYHAESDAQIAEKCAAATQSGLVPVLCVGESLEQREARATEDVVGRQLAAVLEHAGTDAFAGTVVAYEPVWAIGTGKTASPEQVEAVHAFLRS